MRAKRESTSSEERMNVSIDFERTWRGACIPSTTETIPQRFIGAMELKDGELDIGDSSVTNTRCEFAANHSQDMHAVWLSRDTDWLGVSA